MAEIIRSSVAGESGAAPAVQAAPAIPHMLVAPPIVAGTLRVPVGRGHRHTEFADDDLPQRLRKAEDSGEKERDKLKSRG